MSPDGGRLVAIGNFSVVAGQTRHQLAVINLTTTPATLSAWSTTRYQPECATGTPTYMRGVDISGGRHLVRRGDRRVHATPAGCATPPTRWDFGADAAEQAADLGELHRRRHAAVGGHHRRRGLRRRSPAVAGQHSRRTASAAGSVSAARASARSTRSPAGRCSWNPSKERGVGTAEIYATPAGLWIGSDTSTVAGEFHGKIAFFPVLLTLNASSGSRSRPVNRSAPRSVFQAVRWMRPWGRLVGPRRATSGRRRMPSLSMGTPNARRPRR